MRIRRVRFPEPSDPLPGTGLSEGVQAGHENNGKCPLGTTRGDYPLDTVGQAAHYLFRLLVSLGSIVAGMLCTYLDESGSHEASRVFALGGYVGRTEEWERFSVGWNTVLKQEGVDCFHMKEFVARRGAFKGWGEASRITLVHRLARVIRSRNIWGVHYAILLDDYREVAPTWAQSGKQALSPYRLCLEFLVNVIIKGSLARGARPQEIALVLDQQKEFGPTIHRHYLDLQKMSEYRPWLGSFSTSIRIKAPPLQAADFLAYESYKEVYSRMFDPTRKPRKSFETLAWASPISGAYMGRRELIDLFAKWRKQRGF